MDLNHDSRMIIDILGIERHYLNDVLHRVGGPAVIFPDGRHEYRINGVMHRVDGPATVYLNGMMEYQPSWWIRGEHVTTKVNKWMQDRDVTWPWDETTQAEFLLTWT